MLSTFPVSRVVRAAVVAVAGVAAVAAGAAPAQAQSYTGTVTGENGVNVRSAPSIHSESTTGLEKGETVVLECKMRGTSVGDNEVWYAIHGGTEWVTARYVDNVGTAPKWCPQADTETATANVTSDLNVREGPTTADQLVSSVPAGESVEVRCSARSQDIGGDRTWYATMTGQWVTGAYVELDGGVAECNLADAP